MPQTSGSGMVGADRPDDESVAWTAATAVHNGEAEGAASAPDPGAGDETEHTSAIDEALDERLELDLTVPEPAETNGTMPAAPADEPEGVPSSERGAELESEHWRERAIVWRERAMAAELVAKMLQRNLDDLRANLDDLRLKVESAEAKRAELAAAEPPWRRFVRDLYAKYVG
jgi:hypothetical protein